MLHSLRQFLFRKIISYESFEQFVIFDLLTQNHVKMKKISSLIFIIALGALFVNFTVLKNNIRKEEVKIEKVSYHVPDDVQQILDKSCYDCHNSDSDNEKGKKKLQFDKLGELKTYKQVAKLTDIADVINEGDMPPKKVLKDYPEMKLTKEEKEKLVGWAQDMARQLTPSDSK